MNGHSTEYESIVGFACESDERPELYTLVVNGTEVLVDTADACEQFALKNYPLSKDQFNRLTDTGFARASDDTDIQIELVPDGREAGRGE